VQAGDTVVIEVEGVGRLTNYVLTEDEFYARRAAQGNS